MSSQLIRHVKVVEDDGGIIEIKMWRIKPSKIQERELMKVKKVKIGIKSTKKALGEFVQAGEAIKQGQKVKSEKGVYFASLSGFRKALTPKRLELLHIIKEKRPRSLQELARISGRNMKNIITDVALLENLRLIDLHRTKNGRKEAAPRVGYNRISLEIAV